MAAVLLLPTQLNASYIEVSGAYPDFLVILVVVITLIEGQFTGVISGFVLGLLFDLLGNEITGTNALTLMLSGFVSGYFFIEEKTFQESVGVTRFLITLGIAALVRQIFYAIFYLTPNDLTDTLYLITTLLGSCLYTLVFGFIFMLTAARKKE